MEIHIIEETGKTLEVIIHCKQITQDVLRLKSHIAIYDNTLTAKKEKEIYMISSSDVLYFESVDNRTFLYTTEDVFEIDRRLYELENILSEKDFIRISKSQVLNIHKVKSLKPELNRTILATMCNGEKLSISRKYVKDLKELLSL